MTSIKLNFTDFDRAMDQIGIINEDKYELMRKDLHDFLKCIKNNRNRFLALTDFGAVCGSSLSPEVCEPVPDNLIQEILHDFLQRVLRGGFKINGKPGDWSVGFMGSRWLDMDAKSYGLDYIRVAFYSKKFSKNPENWDSDKPYQIYITIEKEKKY